MPVLLLLLMSMPLWAAPGPGVSRELALARAKNVSELSYELRFTLPRARETPVLGEAVIRFRLRDASAPLALDFRRPPGTELSLILKGQRVSIEEEDDHILIPPSALRAGARLSIPAREGEMGPDSLPSS